jgi:hypothetical protein
VIGNADDPTSRSPCRVARPPSVSAFDEPELDESLVAAVVDDGPLAAGGERRRGGEMREIVAG